MEGQPPQGIRERVLQTLARVFGMGRSETKPIEETVGRGMAEGNVTFTPQVGPTGNMEGNLQVKGQPPIRIKDEAETAFLAGLQGQANSKKK